MTLFLVIAMFWCLAWGIVVNVVIENKGYEENWFFWGFFFGIFALIVALSKPNINRTKVIFEESQKIDTKLTDTEPIRKTLANKIYMNSIDIDSAIHVISWDIQKENNVDFILHIKFYNISESIISAVLFLVIGYTLFGDKVFVNNNETFDVIGQDISVESGELGNIYFKLQNTNIRKVDIKVKKVCFSNGKIEENTTSKWIDMNQNPLSPVHLD